MDKEHIPYKESMALKKLCFNEPCYGLYHDNELKLCSDVWGKDDLNHIKITNSEYCDINDPECTSPLYQEAFEWIRTNYNIHIDQWFDYSDTLHAKIVYRDKNNLEEKILIPCNRTNYLKAKQLALEKAIKIIKNR